MILAVCLVCLATDSSAWAADEQESAAKPEFTAVQAKDALLRYIRANPHAFIGDPDPDKLAKIPLTKWQDGKYSLGLFVLDLREKRYSVNVGMEGPEPYFYHGIFTEKDGVWTAMKPEFQRIHRLPKK